MAEFAETNIQATIPELEELERIGLLTGKEIKILIQKRRELEYRLARRSKCKEDIISYINYEKKLLELLSIRRKQNRMYEKYKEIEWVINIRLMQRCRYMTRYWPTHLDTWAIRISFAREVGFKSEASIAYAEQVCFHGNLESVYISWARYEIEVRDNFDVARTILLSKAPLYHGKSILIKREHFRLELLFVESLKKKVEEDKALTEIAEKEREKVLDCEIPRVVYRKSVEDIADPQMYLEFYKIANKFSFAHDIRDEIYRDLVKAFPDSECSWKLKAQRIVLGLEPIEGAEEAPVALLAIDKLNVTIKVFDEAVNAVGPSFVVTYIEELMSMLHECWGNSKLRGSICKKIISLCQSHPSTLLPIHYFVWFWVHQKQSGKDNNVHHTILEDAFKLYPDATPLQLEHFKLILKNDSSTQLKEFGKIASSLKGTHGLQVWEEALKNVKDDELKKKWFQRASNHQNDTIAKGLRINCLEWLISNNKGLKAARKFYHEFGMRPPFCAKLHATMVMAELSRKTVITERVRKIFHNAIQHHGKAHPGVWLSYIHFEKSVGNPLNAGALYTRAENELEAKDAQVFRELNLIISDLQNKKEAASTKLSENEVWVTGNDSKEDHEALSPAVVRLFEEELTLTYSVDQERSAFFKRIGEIKKLLKIGNKEAPKEDGTEWERVLEHLLGQKVPLCIQKVTVRDLSNTEENSLSSSRKDKKKTYELSDHLDPGTIKAATKSNDESLEKILESSLTLKPEFMKQTKLEPYYIGKAKAKAQRMRERKKTKGSGWFNMNAPEMTEELKRDLQVLQMRSVLDPKRPFKNKDMKVLPKYFQMGKIIDSPVDFYSSRVPKKSRKRTIAEEIIQDEGTLRSQKGKFNKMITKEQRGNPKPLGGTKRTKYM